MAARLLAATTSGRPVLFSMDDDAGHGGLASTRNQRQGNMADALAFALWQFGVPEFQPTAAPAMSGDRRADRSQRAKPARTTTVSTQIPP
jgi:hypothetical protein